MKPEINERVRSIADQVKLVITSANDFLSINPETGELGTEDKSHVIFMVEDAKYKIDGDVYKNNLPDGITIETIDKLKRYNSDFKAGALLGVGENTLELMQQNSEITSSTAYIKSEPDGLVNVFIGINEDADEARLSNSVFCFQSNTRQTRDRSPGEEIGDTQFDIVRRQLYELYVQALCEAVK